MRRYKCKDTLNLLAVYDLVVERYRTREREDQEYSHQHAPIADAVHYERFLGRSASFIKLDVVADQQIRAKADAFPANEHQKEIVREHERQHREHEKIQICKKAIKA